mgnify:CR=1 FL=1
MLNKFVEKQMFLITMVLYILDCISKNCYIGLGSWELNRAAGWGWDTSTTLAVYSWLCILFGSFFIFTVCYGILKLRKRKTNFKLSIGHIFLMFLWILTFNLIATNGYIIFIVGALTWGLFITNLMKSEKISTI